LHLCSERLCYAFQVASALYWSAKPTAGTFRFTNFTRSTWDALKRCIQSPQPFPMDRNSRVASPGRGGSCNARGFQTGPGCCFEQGTRNGECPVNLERSLRNAFLFLLLLVWADQCLNGAQDLQTHADCNRTISFKSRLRSGDGRNRRWWNQNMRNEPAACFSEDATYTSVPNVQARKGGHSLRVVRRAQRSSTKIEHGVASLAIRPRQQIGVGEYTFLMMSAPRLVIVKTEMDWSRLARVRARVKLSWSEMMGQSVLT